MSASWVIRTKFIYTSEFFHSRMYCEWPRVSFRRAKISPPLFRFGPMESSRSAKVMRMTSRHPLIGHPITYAIRTRDLLLLSAHHHLVSCNTYKRPRHILTFLLIFQTESIQNGPHSPSPSLRVRCPRALHLAGNHDPAPHQAPPDLRQRSQRRRGLLREGIDPQGAHRPPGCPQVQRRRCVIFAHRWRRSNLIVPLSFPTRVIYHLGHLRVLHPNFALLLSLFVHDIRSHQPLSLLEEPRSLCRGEQG